MFLFLYQVSNYINFILKKCILYFHVCFYKDVVFIVTIKIINYEGKPNHAVINWDMSLDIHTLDILRHNSTRSRVCTEDMQYDRKGTGKINF